MKADRLVVKMRRMMLVISLGMCRWFLRNRRNNAIPAAYVVEYVERRRDHATPMMMNCT